MKKSIILSACMAFVLGAVACSDLFAQRSVNTAQEAAQKAKASLMDKRGGSSSQIEWLNQVISAINMEEPAPRDGSAEKDMS